MERLFQGVGVMSHLYEEAQLPHMLVVSSHLHAHVSGQSLFDVPQMIRQDGRQMSLAVGLPSTMT